MTEKNYIHGLLAINDKIQGVSESLSQCGYFSEKGAAFSGAAIQGFGLILKDISSELLTLLENIPRPPEPKNESGEHGSF